MRSFYPAVILLVIGLIGSTNTLRANPAPASKAESIITTDGKAAVVPASAFADARAAWQSAAGARTAKRLVQLVQETSNQNFSRTDLTQGTAEQIVAMAVSDRTLEEALGLPRHELPRIARVATNSAGNIGKLAMVGITVTLHPELTNVPDNAAEIIVDRVVAGLDAVVRESVGRSHESWKRSLEALDEEVRTLRQQSAALLARVEPMAQALRVPLPQEPGVIHPNVRSIDDLRARVAATKKVREELLRTDEQVGLSEQLVAERQKLSEALQERLAAAGPALAPHEIAELRVQLAEARLQLAQAKVTLDRAVATRDRPDLYNDDVIEAAERIERELRDAGIEETDPFRFLVNAGDELRRLQIRLDELQRTRKSLAKDEPREIRIVVVGGEVTR